MAIGDFVTASDFTNYKVIGLNADKVTAPGLRHSIAWWTANGTYNTDTTIYPDSVTPNHKAFYCYISTAVNGACSGFATITGTSTFKIIAIEGPDAYNQNMVVNINYGEFPRVNLNASRKVSDTTTRSYIIYEINNLDPDRFYFIDLCMISGSLMRLDSVILDVDGTISPCWTYKDILENDPDTMTQSLKWSSRETTLEIHEALISGPASTQLTDTSSPTYATYPVVTDLVTPTMYKIIPAGGMYCYQGDISVPFSSIEGNINALSGTASTLDVGKSIKCIVYGTKKLRIIARPYVGQLLWYGPIEIYIDGVFIMRRHMSWCGSTSYSDAKWRRIAVEIDLPDDGMHVIEIVNPASSTQIVRIDTLVMDQSAIYLPYSVRGLLDRYVLFKDGLYYYNNKSRRLSASNIKYNNFNSVTIQSTDIATQTIMNSGRKRYTFKSGSKVIRPRSTGINITTFKDYTSISLIPSVTNASVYRLKTMASAGTNAYIATMQEVMPDANINPRFITDSNLTFYGGDVGTYFTQYYRQQPQPYDQRYNTSAYDSWFANGYDSNYFAQTKYNGNIYFPKATGANALVYKFKTTSSFVSIWNMLNKVVTPIETGYIIKVNGNTVAHTLNQHNSDVTVPADTTKYELFKITGLQPNDVVEIRIYNIHGNIIHNYGIGIDKTATYTNLGYEALPNYEIVDVSDIATEVLPYSNSFFKRLSPKMLDAMLKMIVSDNPSYTDIEIISPASLNNMYIQDTSDVIYTTDTLDADRQLLAGFTVSALNELSKTEDISKYTIYAPIDKQRKRENVDVLYGTTNTKIEYVENIDLMNLRANELISVETIDVLSENKTPSVTLSTDNETYVNEFDIDKSPFDITKVVIS